MKNYNDDLPDECYNDDGRIIEKCLDKDEYRVRDKPTDYVDGGDLPPKDARGSDGSDSTDKPADGSDSTDKPSDSTGIIGDTRFLTALRFL